MRFKTTVFLAFAGAQSQGRHIQANRCAKTATPMKPLMLWTKMP
jgi:hypothetical protein